MDEAHVIRRRGPQYQYLVHSTEVIVCATATVIHTGLSDLINVGHLLRISYFCSEPGYNAAVVDQRKVDRLRISIPKDEVKRQAEASISGIECVESSELRAWRDGVQGFFKRVSVPFQGHVIRRKVVSKDWLGRPISTLPPYIETLVLLDLTEEEYVLLKLAEERELRE
jgi:hypothetical protein